MLKKKMKNLGITTNINNNTTFKWRSNYFKFILFDSFKIKLF